MEGVFVNGRNSGSIEAGVDSARLKLLLKSEGMEIMTQTLLANDTAWIMPADDQVTLEYFFVHSGALELVMGDETIPLEPGESFYVTGLRHDVMLKTAVDTVLLYVTNSPMFDSLLSFQTDLMALIEQINEKDHYTFRHSRNVMRYSVKLYEALSDCCAGVSLDEMVKASLFHDVGKCYVPTEILCKTEALEMSEYRYLARHPIDSARLLRPKFGERVAEIAQNHHERLDGSGYPFNLEAGDISLEAKIVAVADAFDAMTTDRGYNRVKTMQAAADELCELSDKFDIRVSEALRELVSNGTIDSDGGIKGEQA